MGYKYDNAKTLNKFFAYCLDETFTYKKFIIQKLLLRLYAVGSDSVRGIISDFIVRNSSFNPERPEDFIYELDLIRYGFPVKVGFVDKLNDFINKNIPDSLSDLDFIKAGIEKNMVALLEFIVQKKNITELEVCLNNFNEKMTSIRK